MDDRPARRMRLGTRSCAECRRRKVRCVFEPNSSICRGCELHQTPCRAQQPRARDGDSPLLLRQSQMQTQQQEPVSMAQLQAQSQSHAQLAADNAALRRRVAELEGLVGSICDAIEPAGDGESPGSSGVAASSPSNTASKDISSRAIKVINKLRTHGLLHQSPAQGLDCTSLNSFDVSSVNNYTNFDSFLGSVANTIPNAPSNQSNQSNQSIPGSIRSSSFRSPSSLDRDVTSSSPPESADNNNNSKSAISPVDAPLIHLFRDALMIRDSEGELYDDPEDPSVLHLMKESLRAFRPPIPEPETLRLVLEDSRKFWSIWPPYFFAPDQPTTMDATSTDAAEAYFVRILSVGRGIEFCSAMLFLTLCIQQLPRHWKRVIVSPDIPRQTLIDAYIRFACVLLAVESDEDVLAVQCYLLLHKILINMGRPQRSWVAVRHAISAGTLIGLDRLDASASLQRKILWTHTWMVERQLCLTLGFPSAVTARGTRDEASLLKVLRPNQKILRRLCIIMGRVIERNQSSSVAPYAVTVQLDQDMEDLKNDFPPEWTDHYGPEATTQYIYSEEASKIFYYYTLKHIHLPYMLKARTDRRYEHSRLSSMEACRGLIKSYLRLRGSSKTEVIQCEIMDFVIFTSAITLILGILTPGSSSIEASSASSTTSSPASLTQYAEEWSLIERLVGELRKTNTLLECTVAKQAAQVLETLVAAGMGTYSAAEDFAVVVPYFGRLRIRGRGSDTNDTILNNAPNPLLDNSAINTNSITNDANQTSPLFDSNEASLPISFSSLPQKATSSDPYYVPLPGNTIAFSSNDFLNSTFSDFDFQMDLSQDWCSIVDPGGYDWNYMVNTCPMNFER
ncbi:N-terminal binuclear Zn cluster-containing/DNA binding domain-containing protein [Trichoderma longibrachiatum ATCC 18648]|uniref:N-terminal binuclear Zn cluster-containing/DNA binding domain-containing protein n=1 Tax=Trichoderma longibrachiatum ATCC 18648 TaxID=983965 RepID=A0A2T4BWR6_TRILO|nr:N-terminal binuclear Zn cluster-containing/DNA binding domain-containing protein [Trichoderma longibrachiatum ATCC 18648]